ncbi:hypothetical protein [Yersinia vastinensis]|uniref:hypothetical protein n=1 Tax=Yersinia vastinensis TaxID=2890318 RepID=UPI0005E1A0EE|nr:hypothetical protein [Yersinia vastinensis]OVZ95987.1 hypothetical protein CBW53_17050 [Yersinia frederiksenii]CNI73319.1 Uncharacterised protein [Yersinia frederiksenii]
MIFCCSISCWAVELKRDEYEQSLHDAVTALGNTPGNEWLKTLNLRDDVQWQKVMDAYHRWDHSSQ